MGEQPGIPKGVGTKGKSSRLANMSTRTIVLSNQNHRIRFAYKPKT